VPTYLQSGTGWQPREVWLVGGKCFFKIVKKKRIWRLTEVKRARAPVRWVGYRRVEAPR
jgi:hypothetical protein